MKTITLLFLVSVMASCQNRNHNSAHEAESNLHRSSDRDLTSALVGAGLDRETAEKIDIGAINSPRNRSLASMLLVDLLTASKKTRTLLSELLKEKNRYLSLHHEAAVGFSLYRSTKDGLALSIVGSSPGGSVAELDFYRKLVLADRVRSAGIEELRTNAIKFQDISENEFNELLRAIDKFDAKGSGLLVVEPSDDGYAFIFESAGEETIGDDITNALVVNAGVDLETAEKVQIGGINSDHHRRLAIRLIVEALRSHKEMRNLLSGLLKEKNAFLTLHYEDAIGSSHYRSTKNGLSLSIVDSVPEGPVAKLDFHRKLELADRVRSAGIENLRAKRIEFQDMTTYEFDKLLDAIDKFGAKMQKKPDLASSPIVVEPARDGYNFVFEAIQMHIPFE